MAVHRPGLANDYAVVSFAKQLEHPGSRIDFKRPKRASATAIPCSKCGTLRLAMHMRSERVPGVGSVYRCRVCPPPEKQTAGGPPRP